MRIRKKNLLAYISCVLLYFLIIRCFHLDRNDPNFEHDSSDIDQVIELEVDLHQKSLKLERMSHQCAKQNPMSKVMNLNQSKEAVLTLQKKYPNIELAYLFKHMKVALKPKFSSSCVPVPCFLDLRINNFHWQELELKSSVLSTMYLYSAYWDNRALNLKPCLRLLATANVKLEKWKKRRPFCQIWFKEAEVAPAVTESAHFRYLGYPNHYEVGPGPSWAPLRFHAPYILQIPYQFDCPIPESHTNYTPQFVSIVNEKCDVASNALRVQGGIRSNQLKQDVALCVKPLEFPFADVSVRLLEWLEVQRALGVQKVTIYAMTVHENVLRVLQHYASAGQGKFVAIVDITFPGDQPNSLGRQHVYVANRIQAHMWLEKIAQNDCLFRNLFSFEYVGIMDIDEVIIPYEDPNIGEMMRRLARVHEKHRSPAMYAGALFKHAYFFLGFFPEADELAMNIPEELPLLRHVFRSRISLSTQGKSIHNTEVVTTVTTHIARYCLQQACDEFVASAHIGEMTHYRNGCVQELASHCRNMSTDWVKSTELWKVKPQVLQNVIDVARELDLLR